MLDDFHPMYAYTPCAHTPCNHDPVPCRTSAGVTGSARQRQAITSGIGKQIAVNQVDQDLPVRNMLHPMMGMRKLLVLETNLNERLRWNRVKMSCTVTRQVTSTATNCSLLY